MDYSFKSNTSFEYIKKIGSGGLADVYLYKRKIQGAPDQHVALKVIRDQNIESRLELINEAEKLKDIKHPSILTVLGFEKAHNNQLALVLEYVDGKNLKEIISSRKSLSQEALLYILKNLSSALQIAHVQGVFHGDVTARNVLISKTGEVKLSDFGISKKEGEITSANFKGSVDYFSPQRWQGELPSKESDLFSLGMIIYELITKNNPLASPNLSEVRENLNIFLKQKAWLKLNPFWANTLNSLFSGEDILQEFPPGNDQKAKKELSYLIKTQEMIKDLQKTKTVILNQYKKIYIRPQEVAVLFFLSFFVLFNPVATSDDSSTGKYKRPCLMTITSKAWGEVFINNTSLGYTPLVNIALKPGYHEFLWRNFEGKKVKKTLRAFNNGVLNLQIR